MDEFARRLNVSRQLFPLSGSRATREFNAPVVIRQNQQSEDCPTLALAHPLFLPKHRTEPYSAAIAPDSPLINPNGGTMSSTLDPDNFPTGGDSRATAKGHDIKSLGPSDSSDSGSDMAGPGLVDDDVINLDRGTNEDTEAGSYNASNSGASVGDLRMDDNSDRYGTGEHLTAGKDPNIHINADIDTDRIVDADEAGLGGGLDQAEEARLGVTDEQIEKEDAD
jgi:hypothetical protein